MTFNQNSVFGGQPAAGTNPATTNGGNIFAQPASGGDAFKPKDNGGALVLVKPHTLEQDVQTDYGVSDAVKATVGVVDGPNAGEIYEDTLIFPKLLQSQLKKYVGTGQIVIGRMGQAPARKPGQSPAWKLEDYTDQDAQAAQSFFNDHQATFA